MEMKMYALLPELIKCVDLWSAFFLKLSQKILSLPLLHTLPPTRIWLLNLIKFYKNNIIKDNKIELFLGE